MYKDKRNKYKSFRQLNDSLPPISNILDRIGQDGLGYYIRIVVNNGFNSIPQWNWIDGNYKISRDPQESVIKDLTELNTRVRGCIERGLFKWK